MKKFIRILPLLMILTVLFSAFTCAAAAETEASDECLCGREYYRSDGDGHRIYDCVRCGRNKLSCECPCWCGKKSKDDFYNANTRLCDGCDLPCPECTCRDDKEAILAREKENMSRHTSNLGLPVSGGAAGAIAALLLVAAVICALPAVTALPCFAGVGKLLAQKYDDEDISGDFAEEEEKGFFSSVAEKIRAIPGKLSGRKTVAKADGKYHAPVPEKTVAEKRAEAELHGSEDSPESLPACDALDAYGLAMTMKFALSGTDFHSAYVAFDGIPFPDGGHRILPARFESDTITE